MDQPNINENKLDQIEARILSKLAERTSRKGFLAQTGKMMLKVVGISLLPVLPVDRIIRNLEACCPTYYCTGQLWYLCGMNGKICCNITGCLGGTGTKCPQCATKGSGYWCACCAHIMVKYYDCCAVAGSCTGCSNCSPVNCSGVQEAWCNSGQQYRCTIFQVTQFAC